MEPQPILFDKNNEKAAAVQGKISTDSRIT
jgi:hypothetical protein